MPADLAADTNDSSMWSRQNKESVHKNFHAAQCRSKYFSAKPDSQAAVMKAARSSLTDVCNWTNASLGTKRLHLRWLETCAESKQFKAVVFAVIIINTLVIGLDGALQVSFAFETYDGRDVNGEWHRVSQVLVTLEDIFFYFYCCELVVRVLAHEGLFLVGPEWRWNYFDTSVVALSLAERLVSALGNSSMFRLIRIMRISRSSRAVRLLRVFPSLYPLHFMMLSCTNSLSALCWTCVLVLTLLFVFSAVLTTGVAHYVADVSDTSTTAETLRFHFGSMPMCLLTLFISFLGEAAFREVILVLLDVDVVYCVLYVAFVLFLTLAMANIVAGIFIADAMELASQDREIRQRGDLVRSRKNLQILSTLFREMDPDETGLIYRADFEEQLQRPEVQSLLSYFNFDVMDATAFFTLLDVDGSGCVDIEEFTVGCLRMHGKSNAIDMEISVQETKRLVLSIESALQQETKQIQTGIVSVMQESREHELVLLGKISTIEKSLLGIEERLGIRGCKGDRLAH